MNKQTLKTLIPSMLSLMFITIFLISVSIAWFSMNREVNSNGLQINVEASPNLIIAKTEEAIRSVTQETGEITIASGGSFYFQTVFEIIICNSTIKINFPKNIGFFIFIY